MQYIFTLTMIAGLSASGIALADNREGGREAVAQERIMSAAELTTTIERLGYEVRHLKADDEHFDAHLIDRTSGGAVEAKFNTSSGDLIGARLAHDDREVRERKEERERRETREHEELRDYKDAKKHRESHDQKRRNADD
jgi:hypothetical protein